MLNFLIRKSFWSSLKKTFCFIILRAHPICFTNISFMAVDDWEWSSKNVEQLVLTVEIFSWYKTLDLSRRFLSGIRLQLPRSCWFSRDYRDLKILSHSLLAHWKILSDVLCFFGTGSDDWLRSGVSSSSKHQISCRLA